MGVMKVVLHPPLVLGGEVTSSEGTDFKRFLHARLWLDIELVRWRLRRSGHLRLVRPLEGGEWRCVDLAGHALRLAAEDAIRAGKLTAKDRREVISAFLEGLRGYMYFEE